MHPPPSQMTSLIIFVPKTKFFKVALFSEKKAASTFPPSTLVQSSPDFLFQI